MLGNPLLLSADDQYTIGRSLRLRSSASAYLNRTPASASNRTTWTWSGWIKRGQIGVDQTIFNGWDGSNNSTGFYFATSDVIEVFSIQISPTVYSLQLTTTQVFRDPSAWYHIVLAIDTTQATASNRAKLYVNGVQVTAFAAANYPAQNSNLFVNTNSGHFFGKRAWANTNYLDAYMTEVNFIDGQALTPSSFGANDVNGVWQPKKYTGTYGTNGFYLNFSDNSAATAAAIGADRSGNGNNWTPNNISVTAGVTYDSMVDSPTVGPLASNYCVMNPLNSYIPLQNANLRVISSGISTAGAGATMTLPAGQWYWEATITTFSGASTNILLGITDAAKSSMITPSVSTPSTAVDFTNGYAYTASNGNIRKYAVDSAYGATYTTNDVIGIAYDATNNTITFYKNGTSQGQVTGLTAGTYIPWVYYGGSSATNTVDMNFGQRPFTYTPPTGFKALNTYNLPTPTILAGSKHFDATTYTGNGTSQSIVNSGGFQPDLVWVKERSGTRDHRLVDSVRGAGKELYSDLNFAEATDAIGLTSFNSNGYSIGSSVGYNANGITEIGWQWKGGGTAVSNTNGSITSQVSANPSAGFSVVTWTGTGANATVGHGLGVAPSMIIIKSRGAATDPSWIVAHTSIGMGSGRLILNTTDINSTAGAASLWNSTAASSSVISLGTYSSVNQSGLGFVAYCFSAVRGFSAFGSYTGNGSADGPFVYTGFRPRWILIKRTDTVESWNIVDTARDTYNQSGLNLYPNLTNSESSNNLCDVVSNGFKLRNTWTGANTSGGTYIYAAFAENPFNYSRAR